MMSDPVALALIASLPGALAAIFAGIAAVLGAANKSHIQELDKNINGRVEDLLKHSENSGRLAEQSDIRAREEEIERKTTAHKPREPKG